MILSFTFVGRLTSNNVVTRRVGKRMIANPKAVSDKNKIGMLALEAKIKSGWIIPEACAVTIVCFNSRKDLSNCEKCVGDGMNGIVYRDDSDIIELNIKKCRDLGPERYDITVEPREPIPKPKPLRITPPKKAKGTTA